MIYRNIKSGRTVDIPSVLHDPEWEMAKKPYPVSDSSSEQNSEDQKVKETAKQPAASKTKKTTGTRKPGTKKKA